MEHFFLKKSVKRKKERVVRSDESESCDREENNLSQVESDPIVSDEDSKRNDIRSYKKKGIYIRIC